MKPETSKAETLKSPTISDPRFYKTLEDRQKFFERVCAETPPVQPAFMHRPFFTRRKHDVGSSQDGGT